MDSSKAGYKHHNSLNVTYLASITLNEASKSVYLVMATFIVLLQDDRSSSQLFFSQRVKTPVQPVSVSELLPLILGSFKVIVEVDGFA